MDDEFTAGQIVCTVVVLAIPAVAFQSGRVQRGRLPYRYDEPEVVQSPARPMADYGSWSLPAASGLLDAPVVLLNRWRHGDFALTGTAGEPLARVREISHPRSDDGMRAVFDLQIATAHRYAFEVASPDGVPLFFIDGAEIQTGGTVPNGAGLSRSFAVVLPDGRQFARSGWRFFDRVYADVLDPDGLRLDGDQYEWSKSMIVNSGNRTVPCVAARRTLQRVGRRPYTTLLDADGAAFAQVNDGRGAPMARRLVRFRDRTPAPLRAAAIASMIVHDDERRTGVLAPDPAAPEPYPEFAHTHAAHYRRLRTFMDGLIAERGRRQTG
ncbi:hypothetical protein E1293_20560 [Actinomadura darangshiensis]|uniref:Uncharacterized protein n=1 Tax=Actinomadura darangshiensis TaxID=705336 RepID=A0A4V6PET5_9ACTN|nr:hypothetical protein E1293_20560 [Actinomadura darangshiensis]